MKKQDLINEITFMYQHLELNIARKIIRNVTGVSYISRSAKKDDFEQLYEEFQSYKYLYGISLNKLHNDSIFY